LSKSTAPPRDPDKAVIITINKDDNNIIISKLIYRGADKFLGRPGRKNVTATEDFDVHISYL
jgi:hypothetical protein